MNAVEIEEAVSRLAEQAFDREVFPYAFLEAFGNKPTTIQRLKGGNSIQSDLDGVLQRSNIHLKACGTPTSDSDVDLLVVIPKARRFWMHTTQQIHQKVSAGFPVDVLVRDPGFLAERLHEGDCFLQEITTKGRVMYEGNHS